MAEYINSRAQACQNCVKAKAKCYGHNDGRCERCSRLGKECFMQTPVVRKRKSVKTTYQAQAERIAELEARLNGLVSTLGVSQLSSSSPLSTNLVNSKAVASFPENGMESRPPNDAFMPSPASSHNPGTETLRQVEGERDPDELLDLFRNHLARQVPFIKIPHVNAKTFAQEEPFLYRAIITAASYHDAVHQMALGQEFLRCLTEHVILMGKRNLDMLQGLMVYITWYNSLFHASSQMNSMLGLAFSLVIDLYLYVPSTTLENHEKFLDEMKGIISCHQACWTRPPPSKQDKRVVLGCFYLFSTVSSTFCRFNPLHWTSYIQHCHDDIFHDPENLNDVYLVYLAELTRILEDIKHAGIRSFASQQRNWNAAIAVQFKLLMAELHRFKHSLPESLRDDALMLMHYHAAEMYLFESGFSMPPTTIVHEPTIQRTDALLLCLRATETLTDLYFSIEAKPYINFCPVAAMQIYFAMMTLSKMSLFEADDWDFSKVQTSLDFSSLIGRVVGMMEDASRKYDVRETEKPWLCISRRMNLVKVRFERILAGKDQLHVLSQPSAESGDVDGMPFFMNQFDLLDEEFWQSLPVGTDFLDGLDGKS